MHAELHKKLFKAIDSLSSIITEELIPLNREEAARMLDIRMSRFSEEMWSAGWVHHLEHTLWEYLFSIDKLKFFNKKDLVLLYEIACIAQGWDVWMYLPKNDVYETKSATLDEWTEIHAKWRVNQK